MAKLLGSLKFMGVVGTAVLLLAGGAFACSAEKSADASNLPVVTASKQSLPATDQTTKTKTTDTGTGG
ncbi:MAG TPA: hypothetical protein VFA91_00725 [Candidatus Polarisedimenticolia bacterium]|jgi:hypothetical protein|nr:hypothetical protein [Candidatus Polarisedimenticolia bacterium]